MADLVAYAEHEFKMRSVQKDGAPLRAHLESAAQQGSKEAAARLVGPELPAEIAHVWDWFDELHSARTSNGFGPNALTYSEIEAWNRLTAREVRPFEVEAIKRIDDVYLTLYAQQKESPN